jgi:hypothetical protein
MEASCQIHARPLHSLRKSTGTHWIGDPLWALWVRKQYLSLADNGTPATLPVILGYIDW